MEELIKSLQISGNVLFLMIGAVMVFAMHAGFAFLEVGSVRKKNQVNACCKIICDWGISTIVYFLVGFPIAYGISFLRPASELFGQTQGFGLVHFFFLLAFAACIPAIISGGIAERAKFWPQALAGGIFVGLVYPFFESLVWGKNLFLGQKDSWLAGLCGIPFHDYAGSVVVHSIGGWLALPAIIILGPRIGRYRGEESLEIRASSIPFLSAGSWILSVGWFGFNVMSAQSLTGISGLVALNSLLAMVGGIIAALIVSKNDAVFIHNGALAGLIAICAGSDLVHPLGALAIGACGAIIFVFGFEVETERYRIDDVLGVWPLHGLVGSFGGVAAGIFGQKALGGIGGISITAQLIGTGAAVILALLASILVYSLLKTLVGIRLTEQEELLGADISIHRIETNPEESL